MSIRVALIGCGAWGQNLLRALVQSPRADVVAVADPSPTKLARARLAVPNAALVPTLEDALAAGPTAVVIATPASTHAALVLTALDSGVDVFVEKPLALNAHDADRCAAKAASLGRIGMVGHLLRYHPAVVRMIALAREQRLGKLRHFVSARLRSGGDWAQSVLWSLGPHDLSIFQALDPSPIAAVEAHWLEDGAHVIADLRLDSGVTARIELARESPTKERWLSVAGSSRVASFDDVRAPDRIALRDSVGGGVAKGVPPALEEVCVPWSEPLALEMDHFLECVELRALPRTPFEEGASVVRALSRIEAASQRLVQGGALEPAQDGVLRGGLLGG